MGGDASLPPEGDSGVPAAGWWGESWGWACKGENWWWLCIGDWWCRWWFGPGEKAPPGLPKGLRRGLGAAWGGASSVEGTPSVTTCAQAMHAVNDAHSTVCM